MRLGIRPLRRSIPLGTAVSGFLMIGMGVLAGVLAFADVGMGASGWQVAVSGWLQHVSAVIRDALSWLPGWVLALLLLAGLALLIRRVIRTHTRRTASTDPCACPEEDSPALVTATVEENDREQDQR